MRQALVSGRVPDILALVLQGSLHSVCIGPSDNTSPDHTSAQSFSALVHATWSPAVTLLWPEGFPIRRHDHPEPYPDELIDALWARARELHIEFPIDHWHPLDVIR